jgi:S-adenosylmethionine:tRNA ribosyltransferase-isomerase
VGVHRVPGNQIIMHPRHLNISDFDYDLPEDRIAKFPLPTRDASRLLLYGGGNLSETTYRHIAEHIPAGATLVFNDTRVLEARLLFTKDSGGVIEIFTLEPSGQYPDMETALSQTGTVEWNCLVGGASKWKPHYRPRMIIPTGNGQTILEAEIMERLPDAFRIRFRWSPEHLTFPEILHQAGQIPLPPYLKRAPEADDATRYQTVYAAREGSVAAPTAGLHFTDRVFEALCAKDIDPVYLTLHVGAGTFRPVKSEQVGGHDMHSEYIDVSEATIRALADAGPNIYAVGTTSLRTLESLYWIGVKCMQDPDISPDNLPVSQWEPYDQPDPGITRLKALTYLRRWLMENGKDRLITRTQILLAPGYRFRMIRGLVTNFHQPKSTLLLLIAAIVGDDWKKIYLYAMDNGFRFLSYGDGCLLELES